MPSDIDYSTRLRVREPALDFFFFFNSHYIKKKFTRLISHIGFNTTNKFEGANKIN